MLPGMQLNVRQQASFSLVSVFCSQIFRMLSVTRISVACALFRIRACVAPRVLHFSAFIVLLVLVFLSLSQNHIEEGEEGVKAKLAKLSEDMQEQFRKLEE